ncbi:MAG: protein kinase [Gammaproteobacteria bacterium]|nr:protein kinase [Gammaproteobacteria bacterium]
MDSQAAADLSGRQLGKYHIVRRIGAGNMACVYLARDPFIDRPVAIKVANPAGEDTPDEAAHQRPQFFAEAQMAGMLRHPNITAIFDASTEQGFDYIVMEYVPGGRTLDHYTRPDQLLPPEQITDVLCQCALALDYAHRRGVIHRDVKPRNVLISDAMEVKIADFGVAVANSGQKTGADVWIGSPLYMSPEQIRREPLSGQSDLFSLGIVGYQLLTGRHPFEASNFDAIQHRILNTKPAALATFRADLPDIFQRIIDKALARNLQYRYRSGADFAGDLSLVYDFLRDSVRGVSQQEKFARISGLPFFKDFHDLEIWELIHAGDWLRIPDGTPIISEGDKEASFYVIVDGRVGVLKQEQEILELGTGGCFGEMGLLLGRERCATVMARQETTMLRIRGATVERMSVNAQIKFQRAFLFALIDRLDAVTGRMSVARADATPNVGI